MNTCWQFSWIPVLFHLSGNFYPVIWFFFGVKLIRVKCLLHRLIMHWIVVLSFNFQTNCNVNGQPSVSFPFEKVIEVHPVEGWHWTTCQVTVTFWAEGNGRLTLQLASKLRVKLLQLKDKGPNCKLVCTSLVQNAFYLIMHYYNIELQNLEPRLSFWMFTSLNHLKECIIQAPLSQTSVNGFLMNLQCPNCGNDFQIFK